MVVCVCLPTHRYNWNTLLKAPGKHSKGIRNKFEVPDFLKIVIKIIDLRSSCMYLAGTSSLEDDR